MSEITSVKVSPFNREMRDNKILQGGLEFPIEIAEAELIPVFRCPECGMIHIGDGQTFDDPSEAEQDLETLMNMPETKTPKSRIEMLYKFKKALELRGLI